MVELVVGGLFTLVTVGVGAVIGSVLQTRSAARDREWRLEDDAARHQRERELETARWQRDVRLAAYSKFSTIAADFGHQLAYVDGGAAAHGQEFLDANRGLVIGCLSRLSEAVDSLTLVAPEAVHEMAHQVEVAGFAAWTKVKPGHRALETPDGVEEWQRFSNWVGVWRSAARTDLAGLPVEKIPDDMQPHVRQFPRMVIEPPLSDEPPPP